MKIKLVTASALALSILGCGSQEHSNTEVFTATEQIDAPQQTGNRSIESASIASYVCESTDTICQSSALGAKNDAEATWLKSHGYPNQEEMKRLTTLSPDQLRREADTGSLPAMVIYGESIAKNGETQEGLKYIYNAIQEGSIFGYYGMSQAYLKSPGIRDRIDAAAYLRVAYLLGDSKAGTEIQKNFANLSALELSSIDRRASELYKTFASSKPAVPRP